MPPPNNLNPPLPEKDRSALHPSDPACLSPAMARVNTGPCPDDDPRRIEARAAHDRWSRETSLLAPSPGAALDDLEARALAGQVRMVRQFAPGRYLFTRADGATFDLLMGRRSIGGVAV
jgi:hypothetical protein